jgi:hypothetical protein
MAPANAASILTELESLIAADVEARAARGPALPLGPLRGTANNFVRTANALLADMKRATAAAEPPFVPAFRDASTQFDLLLGLRAKASTALDAAVVEAEHAGSPLAQASPAEKAASRALAAEVTSLRTAATDNVTDTRGSEASRLREQLGVNQPMRAESPVETTDRARIQLRTLAAPEDR